MKRFIIMALALTLLTTQAWAVGPGDTRFTQRNGSNTANLTIDIPLPSGASNGVYVINGGSATPEAAKLAGGLTYDGTYLTTDAIPQSKISGLSTTFAGKFAVPTGSTSQYVRGDGTLATFPSIPSLPVLQSNVYMLDSTLSNKVDTGFQINSHNFVDKASFNISASDVGLGHVDDTADSSKVFATSQIISGTFDNDRIAQGNVTQHQSALALAASQTTTGSFADGRISETSVTQYHAAILVAASQTTSGTFADARISESSVTQHQAALSIAASQVTGTKTHSFISDFTASAQGAAQAYEGTTQHIGAFPIAKTTTTSSGAAAFHLTEDGTSGGTALCANGPIKSSLTVAVNDSSALYTAGWVWSNSDKTVTVTINYLSSSNLLTGAPIFSAAANGKNVNLSVSCY